MNLATWSIRDPIPSILLFFLLTVAGLWGFQDLKVQDLPDIDLPTVSVTLRQPGAAPTQLETEVARLVEDSIATVEGLKHQRTSIGEGQVTITAEFVLERRLADALLDVKDAVDRVRSDLPQDLEEPQVSKVLASSGQPMLTYSVASSVLDEEALSWFVDDAVARAVLGTPGIGQFTRIGGVQREVQVDVDPARLASLGVTAADVSRALKRVQQDASGGRGDLSGMRQGVRTIATVTEARQLAALPIALSDGRSVRLDAVATVRDTIAERSQIALLDGRPAVGFQVYRSRGADETRIAATIEAAIAKLEAGHPDLKFERVSSTVEYVEQQYSGSMLMLYEGAILAVLVVWLFLRDWRATLLGAVALPLSIIPTFAVMSWFGFTLNTVTLLALAVVVGILVDDAIVEIENIARHVRMGKSVREATEEAVTEIATPVIATTMTLVAVFLPTAFMSGVSGQFFKQFGWSIVTAVLTSLLVARLITPMMAVHLLQPHQGQERDGPLMARYLHLVRWCLTHKRATAIAGGVFFVASLLLVPLIPTGLMAAADRSSTMITLELPPGTNFETTLATAERARLAIRDTPGIGSILTTVGESTQSSPLAPSAGGDVRKASLRVTFLERGARPTQSQIERNLRPLLQTVPGARFTIGADSAGQQMQLILSSQDSAALKAHAQALEHGLRELSIISGVTSTASLERPEIVIRPDPARAAERGVTTQAIGETIRVATTGDFDAALSKLNLDSRQIDIRVRIPESARTDLQSLAALRVPGRYGPVPLGSIATLSIESGPSQIDRFDRSRNVTISADLAGTPLGDALTAARKLPAFRALPPGIQVNNTGATEIMAELFGGFGLAMLTAVLCMFCVLVLLFKDFFQPITILSAIPLSAGGAFIALLIARNELGVSSLIGLITLMGIVTKNSILLVEYAIVGIRDRGLSEVEALVDACHKRARPIVMTTVAMIAGMVPLALGIGSDASFRQPMAVAVIGGLVSSTALSLLLVPVAFLYVTRLERLILKRSALEAVVPPPRPAA